MSLSLALNNALSGLSVNQKALSVISHNLSNANTEGYTRQVLDLSASYYNYQGSVGTGVQVDAISRKVDLFLQNAIRSQSSAVGQTTVIQDYFEKIQTIIGEPGDTNSIDEYIQTFFNAIQNLAETPDSVSQRENAVDSGITLAQQVADLATRLQEFRYQADQDIRISILDINEQLRNLENLNIAIAQADVMGTSKADLQDDQDRAMEKLSEYLDIKVSVKDSGQINIFTSAGITLLGEYAYELTYSPAPAIETFTQGKTLNPIMVRATNDRGQLVGEPVALVTGGTEDTVTTGLRTGKLKGLLDLRDDEIPNVLNQLDQLAGTMRDTFNAIHNLGSAYPGTNELTGTRAVSPETRSQWEGGVRIAVLQEDGTPVPAPYDDESYTGWRPLTLDLSTLKSATGDQLPTLQTLVDEINNYFYPPPVKAELGNLNNIQLVADTDRLPNSTSSFSFDFDLDNISGLPANFYMTDVQVVNSLGVPITAVTTPAPRSALNVGPSATYDTTVGSNIVTVNATDHGFSIGDRVFLTDSGLASVNGIPGSLVGGVYVEITSVINADSFTFDAGSPATAPGPVISAIPAFAYGAWDTIDAGEKTRTRDAGVVELDLTGFTNSAYYDITVTVGVDDEQGSVGQIQSGTITYRIYNNQTNLYNDRFNAQSSAGQVTRVTTEDTSPLMRAILVDEDGAEVPSTNGVYVADRPAFLKLVTYDDTHGITIEDLGSKELGIPIGTDKRSATNRGFSHYFELNNFFESNIPTDTGDTVKNSAQNMAVQQRFWNDSNLISLGTLELSNQPADPDATPLYTYERNISGNTIIQRLAKLGITQTVFAAAGGLAATNTTFNGYAGNILAYSATTTVRATTDNRDNTTILNGYQERSDAFSGVNVDEELAFMQVFQQAYAASARIITTTNEMFDTLLGAFQ